MRKVIFVFGSNLAGRHGAGAAKEAVKHWSAKWRAAEGRTGNAYALPTKDAKLVSLSLDEIQENYRKFWNYANDNPELQFLLTPCGAGLAGYSLDDIRTVWLNSGGPLRNVWLTGDWYLTTPENVV